MLEIKKITKVYETDSFKQIALDDVSVNFRSCEFASILGPSGSGKTTLLNVIGGLDKYDHGDLIINETSTKKYKDRDWDSYRNHRVGFVFQNYNLISHQSVLANVELALTLSGVSKKERTKRAKEALDKVGLKKHMKKRPNQLSGGQMQRVAIARALVNDPEILLADEPTGALDTETSKQVMDILKSVAKDRLVIMVTHNPELAQEYSTRIIKLKDGRIIDDSNPYDGNVNTKEEKEIREAKSKKTSMNLSTALSLSLNNLMTKKGRTILTAFAGAIGIIGIALVLSISTGVQDYISSVEEDTLSSYPITIEAQKIDATSLLESIQSTNEDDKPKGDNIATRDIMGNMISVMSSDIQTNDVKKFKEFLEKNEDIKKYTNAIGYSYNLNLQIYQDGDELLKLNPSNLYDSFGVQMSEMYSSMMASAFTELIDNEDLLKEQYEVVAGRFAKNYDEVVLVVDENNMISDYTAYSLGLKDRKELDSVMSKMISGEKVEFKQSTYSFDDILNLKFKVLLNSDYYQKKGNIWVNMESDEKYVKNKLKDALELKVVGIIRINAESVLSSASSYGTISYTHDLTEYVINKINESEVAKAQKANPEVNILTGAKFGTGSFDINSLSAEQRKYFSSLSPSELEEAMKAYTASSYESNLINMGVVDLESPSIINLYPKDFASKDKIKNIIEDYNEDKKDEGKDEEIISYTDYVGLLMSSVTTIVDIISYVLIAFVSVSLIVSSIMIGIITYISVLERTKEIGILRSIGASKKDISRVFNAETFIVGALAGIIGVVVTLLLNIPINMIIKNLSGINNIAKLPILGAIILVIISMALTIIAGLIPAKMASKKDPVEALRSE